MAEAAAHPKLTRKAARVRGAERTSQIRASGSVEALRNRPAKGTRTIRESHVVVIPKVSLKPGMGLDMRVGSSGEACRSDAGFGAKLPLPWYAYREYMD